MSITLPATTTPHLRSMGSPVLEEASSRLRLLRRVGSWSPRLRGERDEYHAPSYNHPAPPIHGISGARGSLEQAEASASCRFVEPEASGLRDGYHAPATTTPHLRSKGSPVLEEASSGRRLLSRVGSWRSRLRGERDEYHAPATTTPHLRSMGSSVLEEASSRRRASESCRVRGARGFVESVMSITLPATRVVVVSSRLVGCVLSITGPSTFGSGREGLPRRPARPTRPERSRSGCR